jgi:hypothetical protein
MLFRESHLELHVTDEARTAREYERISALVDSIHKDFHASGIEIIKLSAWPLSLSLITFVPRDHRGPAGRVLQIGAPKVKINILAANGMGKIVRC